MLKARSQIERPKPVSCRLLLGSIPKSEEVLWRYMMDEYGIAYRNILPGNVHEMCSSVRLIDLQKRGFLGPGQETMSRMVTPQHTGYTYYLNWIEDRSTKTQCICCMGSSYTTLNIPIFYLSSPVFSHVSPHFLRLTWFQPCHLRSR